MRRRISSSSRAEANSSSHRRGSSSSRGSNRSSSNTQRERARKGRRLKESKAADVLFAVRLSRAVLVFAANAAVREEENNET